MTRRYLANCSAIIQKLRLLLPLAIKILYFVQEIRVTKKGVRLINRNFGHQSKVKRRSKWGNEELHKWKNEEARKWEDEKFPKWET